MRVGFVGLGHAGGKLAGSLVRNAAKAGLQVTVRDLDRAAAEPFLAAGAGWADSPRALAEASDVLITCLPSPAASAAVMEGPDGALSAWRPGMIWAEASTTDADEVRRIGAMVTAKGGHAADTPVSGGVHRAATGNISVFAGCERDVFERLLPLLTIIGRRVLHVGPLGTASTLKVMTNYLATAHLVALTEALTTMAAAGMDLATTYEAIRISSGNSFVHETESQVILNGSRDISFTMQLVLKDIGLHQAIADAHGVPLELSPLLVRLFEDGKRRYGPNEWSPNIIRRLEEATGLDIRAAGFPADMVDDEPEEPGYEVVPRNRRQPGKEYRE